MKDLSKKLIELGLLSDSKKATKHYQWKKSGNSQFEIASFIKNKPYWSNTSYLDGNKGKKLILNYWQCLFSPSIFELKFWAFFLQRGFTLYVYTTQGELEEIKSIQHLNRILNINILNNDILIEFISTKGENANDYFIIDRLTRRVLLKELAYYFNFAPIYPLPERDDDFYLRSEYCPLSLEQANLIKHLVFTGNIKTLSYMHTATKTEFEWFLESSNIDEITTQLGDINIYNNPSSLHLALAPYLIDIKFSDVTTHLDIDYKTSPRLRKINLTSEEKTIHKLEQSNAIEAMILSGYKDISSIYFNHYASLKQLELQIESTILSIKGLENCMSLEEVKLNDICSINPAILKHLPTLPKLKKLIIDASLFHQNFDKLLLKLPEKIACLDILLPQYIKEIDLSRFKHLRQLSIKKAGEESPIKVIFKFTRECESLEELSINNIPVMDMSNLKSIKRLKIENMKKCKKLQFCKLLEEIEIRHYYSSHSFLSNYFINLRKIIIESSKIKNIQGLHQNIHLEDLVINNCELLESFNLGILNQLRRVIVYNCKKIKKFNYFDTANLEFVALKNVHDHYGLKMTHSLRFPRKDPIQLEKPLTENNHSTIKPEKMLPEKPQDKVRKKKTNNSYSSSIISEDKETKFALDLDTKTDENITVHLPRLFTNLHLDKLATCPIPNQYRLKIYDRIEVDRNETVFIRECNPRDSLEKTAFNSELKAPLYQGILVLKKGVKEYILPGLSSGDKLVSLTYAECFDIFFSFKTNQYLLRVKPDLDWMPDIINYVIKPSEHYYFKSSDNNIIYSKIKTPVFPFECIEKLQACLKKKKFVNLRRLFETMEKATCDNSRINLIKNYCQFMNASILTPSQENLDGLMTLIEERKGSCRHSALVFMLLCQYHNIPCRIVINDCHSFAEIALLEEQGLVWRAIDLGGSSVTLLINENPFAFTADFAPLKKENDFRFFRKLFLSDEHWKDYKDYRSLINQMINHRKPVLLRVPQSKDAWFWHHAITAQLAKDSATQRACIFIDSVEEMRSLFETIKIDKNASVLIPGPLKKLIQTNKGLFIINWANFNARERASYKSVMDNPPTLHGETVAPGIQVIGIIPDNILVNDVFLSRCDEIKNHPLTRMQPIDNYNQREGVIFTKNSALPEMDEALIVNLFHSPDWSKFLVEDITIHGDQFHIATGPLVEAAKTGRSIIIQKPPLHDDYFQRFWHFLLTDNRILFNGEFITIHPKCRIIIQELDPDLHPPSCFIVDTSLSKNKTYTITRENYYQLFEMQLVDKTHKIHSQKGLLARYKKGEQIVVRDILEEDQWQRLYAYLTQSNPNGDTFAFHFYIEPQPNFKPETVEIAALYSHLDSFNTQIISMDPHFIVKHLETNQVVLPQHIFYLTKENSWSTLIEEINPYYVKNKIRAKRHDLSFWKALKKGETVVLCGDLPVAEYRALQPLFCDEPHLYVNGKRIRPKGKLLWVRSPKAGPYSHTNCPPILIEHRIKDYKRLLRSELTELNERFINGITYLFKTVSFLKAADTGYPSEELYNYQKFKTLYQSIITQEDGIKNAIKPLLNYHYRKDGEQYAYIGVIIKCLVKSPGQSQVRLTSLNKLLSQIHSKQDFLTHFWRIMNCFNSEAIHHMGVVVKFKKNEPAILPLPGKKLKKMVASQLIQHDPTLRKKHDWLQSHDQPTFPCFIKKQSNYRYKKQKHRLISALKDKNKPLIYLIGDSGTGKTSSIKAVAKKMLGKDDLFIGENSIEQWLQSNGNMLRILLLDEINLTQGTTWEFLRGLTSQPRILQYKGKTYFLSDNHKIVATGNPQHYTGRYPQPILQDLAYVIYYKPFQTTFIETKVETFLLKTALNVSKIARENVISLLVKSYDYLRRQQKTYSEITLRDMKNSCIRLALIKKNAVNGDWLQATSQAIYEEMAGILKNDDDRNSFKQFLLEEGSRWKEGCIPSLLPQDLIIPPEKYDLWQLILDDISLRNQALQDGSKTKGKSGLLLVGPSGIGKSTLLTKALELSGFSPETMDTQKKYYQITAGCEQVRDILIRAFHEGSMVILDELNLEEELELILNQFLSGEDMFGNPPKKPGFMLLSSQNPPHYAGCQILSVALMNRLHVINMADYSKGELKYIAFKAQHPKPNALVEAFDSVRKTIPGMNARKFFTALNQDAQNRREKENKVLQGYSALSP